MVVEWTRRGGLSQQPYGGTFACDIRPGEDSPSMTISTRVLSRPGMAEEKPDAIPAKQMPNADKRGRAHFLVDTGRGFQAAETQVRGILRALAGRPGRIRTGARV